MLCFLFIYSLPSCSSEYSNSAVSLCFVSASSAEFSDIARHYFYQVAPISSPSFVFFHYTFCIVGTGTVGYRILPPPLCLFCHKTSAVKHNVFTPQLCQIFLFLTKYLLPTSSSFTISTAALNSASHSSLDIGSTLQVHLSRSSSNILAFKLRRG